MAEGTVVPRPGGGIYAAKGAEAGKDEKYRKMQIEKYREEFLESRGWAGIAGAAKRPKDWEKQFRSWYKAKAASAAKNKAQKKAVGSTE